jgi:hypothetical protein
LGAFQEYRARLNDFASTPAEAANLMFLVARGPTSSPTSSPAATGFARLA